MVRDLVYLKSNVCLEPMINQWYAWPYLVAPHTLAMYTTHTHLKIMKSYLQAPDLHANMARNPKMLGGPFLDLPGDQSGLVEALVNRIELQCRPLIELSQGIRELNQLLLDEAKGHSLIPLYPRIPDCLKGYVELVYDINNQPAVRFFEKLLYKSRFYQPENQSISLSLVDRDQRPFLLSTPRFPGEGQLNYSLPFKSQTIDRLFGMRENPQTLDYVSDFMPAEPKKQLLFRSMFTEQPPRREGRDRDSLEQKLRIRYCGHATLLFETKDVSILTDPILSYEVIDKTVPRFTQEDMPATIDYVLITHNHQDHVLFESLLQLRHKIKHLVIPTSNRGCLQDPSLKEILLRTGFENLIELEALDQIPLPGGTLTALPFLGEHTDLDIQSKIGYFLELNGKTIVCVCDSNNISPEIYHHVRDLLGPAQVGFIGMECQGAPLSWLYGSLMTSPLERGMDQSRRFDASDAGKGMEMVESLNCQSVYVYAMGQEPWATFISSLRYTEQSKPIVESNKLVQSCREKGLNAERLFGKKEILL